MKKFLKRCLLGLLILQLSACQFSQPIVGVTVYPIEYLVTRLGGDRVQSVMMSEGETIIRSTIHPEFDERLGVINVLFYFGQLEPYFPIIQQDIQNTNAQIVNLTTRAGVYRFQRYETTIVNSTPVTIESPYYKSSLFEYVDMYDTDPVLWMDPITMISMAVSIRDWLSTNFPEERSFFNRNFDQLEFELARLDASYQDLRFDDIAFVSMTPSFGNWQKAYGIQVYPLILSRFGVLPSEQQLLHIMQRIRDDGVRYIAYEPNLSKDMILLYERVKTELNLEVIELHSLSFLTQEDISENKNYLTIMYENLSVLEEMNP